jgi:DNA-binding response OmpR family regulator
MARKKTILVVEDEPHCRVFLAMVLEDEGYHVETATDGCEALRKARDLSPDAILLDLMLPVLDGAGFLHEYRTDPEVTGVPVVAMSAGVARARADTLGAQAMLCKPFDYDVLLTTLANVL